MALKADSQTIKLTAKMVDRDGIVFLRTLRPKAEIIYGSDEEFEIGDSKVVRSSDEAHTSGLEYLEKVYSARILKSEDLSREWDTTATARRRPVVLVPSRLARRVAR